MKLRRKPKRAGSKKRLQFSEGSAPVKSTLLQPAWENRDEEEG